MTPGKVESARKLLKGGMALRDVAQNLGVLVQTLYRWVPAASLMTPVDPDGRLTAMNDVTRILSAIEQGDPKAAEQLLPLVYDELRKLAAQRLAQEKPGQTLQATALVHEAYLRLVGTDDPGWDSRGHFFAAAAEAMRRILVENARRKAAAKAGGGRRAARPGRGRARHRGAAASTCWPWTRP